MATFITLLNFTDQGARNIRESPARAVAAKEVAKKFGVEMEQVWWTMGGYDMVVQCEAPDADACAAFISAITALGNVRGQTLRAFDSDQFTAIVQKGK